MTKSDGHQIDISCAQRTAFYLSCIVDLGFLTYWLVIWSKLVPDEFMFKDYTNPILQAWNWSFLPLDLLVSFSGLLAFRYWKKQNPVWQPIFIVSLSLMFCAGLQAIAFWWIRGDFEWSWWIMNFVLIVIPIFSGTLLFLRRF